MAAPSSHCSIAQKTQHFDIFQAKALIGNTLWRNIKVNPRTNRLPSVCTNSGLILLHFFINPFMPVTSQTDYFCDISSTEVIINNYLKEKYCQETYK